MSSLRDLQVSYALVEVIVMNTTSFFVSTSSHSLTYAYKCHVFKFSVLF